MPEPTKRSHSVAPPGWKPKGTGGVLKIILLPLLLPSLGWAAPGEVSVTDKTRALLQSEYAFDPTKIEIEPASRSEEVVMMPALTVTASIRHRQLERAVQERTKQAAASAYSVVRGGTLVEKHLGPAKVLLGTWSVGPNLGLLKISW